MVQSTNLCTNNCPGILQSILTGVPAIAQVYGTEYMRTDEPAIAKVWYRVLTDVPAIAQVWDVPETSENGTTKSKSKEVT